MAHLTPKDLLQSSRLDAQQVTAVLSPYGLKDIKKALLNLHLIANESLARQVLSEIIEKLLDSLSLSPQPDQALTYFERFINATFNKMTLLSYLRDFPYTLMILTKVFGSSPFLSEILIRHPLYLLQASDPRKDLARDLSKSLRHLITTEGKLIALCVFKQREILRIGVRDLVRKSTVDETTASLSALADVLITEAYEICEKSLRRKYGSPRTGFAVLGMGKLGGNELNFSSDVDLIYLYASDDGRTSGGRDGNPATRISNAEYFTRLSQEITSALSAVTDEGSLYRVDLRLRPEGRMGPLASSLTGYQRYYSTRGETWERLALLKARPVAGNRSLGKRFLQMVSPFIYKKPFTFTMINEVKTMKEKINRKIAARGQTAFHVKLGPGGIREIEFIVQSLQAFFGERIPTLRERHTLKALKKLSQAKLLTTEEYRHLSEAYIFLRDVEHKLQMVYGLQTHTFSSDPEELQLCAFRLDYKNKTDSVTAGDQFLADYRLHTKRVSRIFRGLFYTPQKWLVKNRCAFLI